MSKALLTNGCVCVCERARGTYQKRTRPQRCVGIAMRWSFLKLFVVPPTLGPFAMRVRRHHILGPFGGSGVGARLSGPSTASGGSTGCLASAS